MSSEINNPRDQIYGPGVLNPRLWHKGHSRPALGALSKRESQMHPGEGGEGQAALNRQIREVLDHIQSGASFSAHSQRPIRAQVLAHFHGFGGAGPQITSQGIKAATGNLAGPWIHEDAMLFSQLGVPENLVFTAVYARIPELDFAFDVPEAGLMEDGTPYSALGWQGPFDKVAAIMAHRIYISRRSQAQVPPLGSIITVEIPGGDLESKFAIWNELVVPAALAQFANRADQITGTESPPSRAFDTPQFVDDSEDTE